ncbi:hypothetical protein BRADI_1g73883v3, partial [Brachypodium distachyon]
GGKPRRASEEGGHAARDAGVLPPYRQRAAAISPAPLPIPRSPAKSPHCPLRPSAFVVRTRRRRLPLPPCFLLIRYTAPPPPPPPPPPPLSSRGRAAAFLAMTCRRRLHLSPCLLLIRGAASLPPTSPRWCWPRGRRQQRGALQAASVAIRRQRRSGH